MRTYVPLLIALGFLVLGAFYVLPADQTRGHGDSLKASATSASPFSFFDSTFADADWTDRIVIDDNAGTPPTYTAEQAGFGLPAPSRYVIHTFTCDSVITTRVAEASWATTSLLDPDGETVQFVSFRFDIFAGNVAIHPVVVQDDTVYLGPSQQLFLPFVWKVFEAQELRASDFAVWRTNQRPDFSRPMMFGYATHNSAPKQNNCPREIVTQTHVDNFHVRVNETVPTGGNNVPIVRDDILVARMEVSGFGSRAEGSVNVLYNDYDPDGDSLSLNLAFSDHRGRFGGTVSYTADGNAVFSWDRVDSTHNTFRYGVTDGAAVALGNVLVLIDCACAIACWLGLNKRGDVVSQEIDLDFIRRFRDDAMAMTEHGARFVDLYYNRMPEMLKLLIIDHPNLGLQAVQMVELVQPVLQNFLDGDGTMTFAQEQMDAIGQFASNLSAVSSDSLKATIEAELARLGPLDDYVGRPVSEALGTVLGDATGTGSQERSGDIPIEIILKQNYPNPFSATTTFSFALPKADDVTLTIVDVLGRMVRDLASGTTPAGTHDVTFDATGLSSGVYFYRLQAGDYVATKRMVVVN